MSFTEVKESVVRMTGEERLELGALLLHLSRKDDPDYREELTRRANSLEQGRGVDLESLRRHHAKLSDASR